MEKVNWEEERDKRKKESLERHARLHKLFIEDRFAFEQERKKIVDDFINNVRDEEMRNRLRELQNSWDTKMRHAGSEHNRFILAQVFFWNHFFETWFPAIQRFNFILNGKPS